MHDLVPALARRQHGAVTRAQLLEIGVRSVEIGALVRARRLTPRFRGVYVLADAVMTAWATAAAAVLAARPAHDTSVLDERSAAHRAEVTAAVISQRSAAVLLEYLHGEAGVVELACRHVCRRPGLSVRRLRLRDDEVITLRGIPLTSPARTILDLAGVATSRELEQALAAALRRRPGVTDEVHTLLARYPRSPGRRMLAALLAEMERSGAPPLFLRSPAEEMALDLIRRARLPEPRTNVRILGLEVDFVWSALRLVVEVDGRAYHDNPRAFDRDRQRDATLSAAGHHVIRFTYNQLKTDTLASVATLAAVIAERRLLLGG
jgi:very-short-patch-repair endonuclease